jgi:hypothetical protein
VADQTQTLKAGTAKTAYNALSAFMLTGASILLFSYLPKWAAGGILGFGTPVILFAAKVFVNWGELIADSLPKSWTKPIDDEKPLEVRT